MEILKTFHGENECKNLKKVKGVVSAGTFVICCLHFPLHFPTNNSVDSFLDIWKQNLIYNIIPKKTKEGGVWPEREQDE